MFKPLSLYIGLRYTRAKRRNHFISFISLASMLGIALGVTVLITVLSIMNGFDDQIRQRFFAIAPQVTVMTGQNIQESWPSLVKNVGKLPGVVAAAPYASGNGMLMQGSQMAGVKLMGIVPSLEAHISKLNHSLVAGSLSSLTPDSFHIVIGQAIADALGINIGDKINVLTPQTSVTLAGVFPRYKTFQVSGIYHSSGGLFDSSVAFINMEDAQKLFLLGQRESGVHLKLDNLYQAPEVTKLLQQHLSPAYMITNWTVQFGAFFQALAMEKTMLFIVLLLIIAVAAFNLVSSLVMLVNDKRADIAILRTLGARPRTIMMTFVIQGMTIGVIGTLLGLLGGLALSSHVTSIANFLQDVFHIQFVRASVFFIDFVPSKIVAADIWHVAIAAIILSALATLYPAWVAFRLQPAEALRYE